jgi:glutathione peroxidase
MSADDIYQFEAQSIDGKSVALPAFKGKVLLILNVASKCGHTKQYAALEAMYRKYQPQGLEILGFPCNQFGGQEPGDDSQIREFCTVKFGVTFPLFAKVKVNGPEAHPLFPFLKERALGEEDRKPIKWNFTKFLVSRKGEVRKRFLSRQTPAEIEAEIVAELSR